MVMSFTGQEAKLKVEYEGRSVNSLSSSWVMIWNNGTDTINRSNISERNSLRLQGTRGAKVFEAFIGAQSDIGNMCTVHLTPSSGIVSVDFHYLNAKQGLIVCLVHTGQSSDYLAASASLIDMDTVKKVTIGPHRIGGLPKRARADYSAQQNLARRWIALIATGALLTIAAITWTTYAISNSGDITSIAFFFSSLTAMLIVIQVQAIRDRILHRLPVNLNYIQDERTLDEYWA